MRAPTPYPDLNGVLDAFVASVPEALGDNFCGVYLVGSFVVGDADEHIDVDFFVASLGDVIVDDIA